MKRSALCLGLVCVLLVAAAVSTAVWRERTANQVTDRGRNAPPTGPIRVVSPHQTTPGVAAFPESRLRGEHEEADQDSEPAIKRHRGKPVPAIRMNPAPGRLRLLQAGGDGSPHAFPGLGFQDAGTNRPADTQIAVGPDSILEMVNSDWAVWSKTGVRLTYGGLDSFFRLPGDYYCGDPQVLYDAVSSRWLASCLAVSNLGIERSMAVLAASQTSVPTGAWSIYVLSRKTGAVPDQPLLSVSTDKVVLSWNNYKQVGKNSPINNFTMSETAVVAKADVQAGRPAHEVLFGPDFTRFRPTPVRELSPTDTAYAVYNQGSESGIPVAGVVSITGVPGQSPVAWHESGALLHDMSLPVAAVQPDRFPRLEATGNNFTSAVWRDGILWLAAPDACRSGAGKARDCLRLVQLDTRHGNVSLLQDFDVGQANTDFIYPAVTMDGAGNLGVVFTQTSATIDPGVAAVGQAASSPGTISPPVVLAPGGGPYDCRYCLQRDGAVRWGDYSAATVDPSNPSIMWLAGELAASPSDEGDWGTEVAPVTISSVDAAVTAQPLPTSAVDVATPAAGAFPIPIASGSSAVHPTVTTPQPPTVEIDEIDLLQKVGKQTTVTTTLVIGPRVDVEIFFHYPGPKLRGGKLQPGSSALFTLERGARRLLRTKIALGGNGEEVLGTASIPTRRLKTGTDQAVITLSTSSGKVSRTFAVTVKKK